MHGICPAREKFWRAVQSSPICDILETAATVFVAYSGGADSAALLSMMAEYAGNRGLRCEAIHVHHGIRGAEADRDAECCRAFCLARNIPLHIEYVDAPAYAAEHRVGLEEAARTLRYGVLRRYTEQSPDSVCATAHSADDQLETVLFHLMRGSGLEGMCGIPAVRDHFIRPLLTVSAADIRDYCALLALPTVTDSTNGDTAYTRNYIRAEIVPRLRQITPHPEEAAVRLCRALCSDSDYLHQATRAALGEWAQGTEAPLACLRGMEDAILYRVIGVLYENAAGAGASLSSCHREAVRDRVRQGGTGQIALPGGLCAQLQGGVLRFCEPPQVMRRPQDFFSPLRLGDNPFPQYGFLLRIEEKTGKTERNSPRGENIYKLSICYSFPFATIQGDLHVRFRRPGDTVRCGGMTRVVRKLMNAAALPVQIRDAWPVIGDGTGILWIPGVCARDKTEAESGEKTVVLTYFPLETNTPPDVR